MTMRQCHGKGHDEMQRGGADNRQTKNFVSRKLGCNKATGYLRDQVAPEEGGVHMALHSNGPVHEDGLAEAKKNRERQGRERKESRNE